MMDEFDVPRIGWPWSARVALAISLGLTGVGLLTIHTTEAAGAGGWSRAQIQAAYALVGLAALFVIGRIGHTRIGRWSYPMFFVVLALLVILVIARKVPLDPFFPMKRKTARWLVLGPIQLQPSELAKVAYVLALANYLKFRSNYRTVLGLVGPFVMTVIPVALILVEPDLGTSILLLPVLFIMLFAAGARRLHLAAVLGMGIAVTPIFYYSGLMKPYQRERIAAVFRQNDPDERWQMGPGFQLRQSKMAIGSGQWLGQDMEDAAFFRHDLLPEEHNDFIFAVIGHQWGFVGATVLIGMYFVLMTSGFVIASSTDDPFARLLAVGVTAMIGVQALINIGMTIGLTPITGMTLPFISAGGSSLLTTFLAVGLLISVARRRPILIAHKPFEFHHSELQG